MQLRTGKDMRLLMAGYLFIFTGSVMALGMMGRAILGFMGQGDGRSPAGYLALAWLMIVFMIVGRIILKMAGDVKEEDTYIVSDHLWKYLFCHKKEESCLMLTQPDAASFRLRHSCQRPSMALFTPRV